MSIKEIKVSYSDSILEGFEYLLKNYPEVFIFRTRSLESMVRWEHNERLR